MEIRHRFVSTNGIRMHVAEQGEGPLVVLCHGFPESWYSWRHQMAALAAAGYHVVAPDQRGYGQTERPEAVEAYTLCHLAGDIVGLVHALGEENAAIVGHDWGAPVAWTSALLRPDMFRALTLLSVPFLPEFWSGPKPTDGMRAIPRQVFYQLYFQEPGKAERDMEADVRATMLGFYYSASGDPPPEKRWRFLLEPGETIMETLSFPEEMPKWFTEQDLDFYTGEFQRAGFRGGLNWYRNLDRDWELLRCLNGAKITQPTLFVAGELDSVIMMYRKAFDEMERAVPKLESKNLLAGAGHWIQQERPDEVNRLLLEFLKRHYAAR